MIRAIPGVLARFPTAEGMEKLCQQLEAFPGQETLAAANALSVCTREADVNRGGEAFATARRIRKEVNPEGPAPFQMPLEYQRLERGLADPKADLSGIVEGPVSG